MKKISIGNDIVSLSYTNFERSQTGQFYSKFISEKEIELFKQKKNPALNFHQFIWLCWSAKEAIFKYQKRLNGDIRFSPRKIILTKLDCTVFYEHKQFKDQIIEEKGLSEKGCHSCEFNFESCIFYTRSLVCEAFIFSLANYKPVFDDIYWGIKKIDINTVKFQSELVRHFLIQRLKKDLVKSPVSLIKNESGVPVIQNQENIIVSFSHHERFISYALIIS